MEMSPAKNISKNQRAASPLAAIIAVAIVAVLAVTLILAAAPAGAAGVGSTSTSVTTDKDSYKVAPDGSVTIKVSDLPAALAEVNFEDEDGFVADEFFTVTVVEDSSGLNASVKIKAADDTPLGEYLVDLVAGDEDNTSVEVTLTVQETVAQVITGNLLYIGGGIVLIAAGYVGSKVIRNKTAKRITKPLSILLYIAGAACIAWVAWLIAGVYL